MAEGSEGPGARLEEHTVSAWQRLCDDRVGLHCREAPLPLRLAPPPENCGMCCLVMTLPWVHDSQPQPGSVWVPTRLNEQVGSLDTGFSGGTG